MHVAASKGAPSRHSPCPSWSVSSNSASSGGPARGTASHALKQKAPPYPQYAPCPCPWLLAASSSKDCAQHARKLSSFLHHWLLPHYGVSAGCTSPHLLHRQHDEGGIASSGGVLVPTEGGAAATGARTCLAGVGCAGAHAPQSAGAPPVSRRATGRCPSRSRSASIRHDGSQTQY